MADKCVNRVELIGRLGKDAETKFTQSGKAKTVFSVAITRRVKDSAGNWGDSDAQWFNVVAWDSENVANYLLKGTKVRVEGRLDSYSYEAKDGSGKRYVTEVVANDIMLLMSKPANSNGGDQVRSAPRSAQQSNGGGWPANNNGGGWPANNNGGFDPGITDDDVPF